MAIDVRADLVEAHRRSLEHITAPGSRFDAATRVHIAEVVAEAYLRLDPPPPWARVHGDPVLNGAARLARHAGTITESWYHALLDEGLDPLDWIEVVGVVVSIVPVVAFARAIDAPVPEFPALRPGAPTGNVAAELASAALNWVPVAAPADQRASVVQALSALPDEDANLWRLAAAQYMSDAQMADPEWNRGSLSRPQMELIAGRLSLLRECFF